ncbi:uncharacterized protein LOC129958601 [Argiope bruennichi]|uniref:Uncharacterized protein n=1 Tax=Argiope bruennichi TaxID=94029 RepID=A0A8T0F9V7_ARGBR|nr:uncharacterized protein LOC129958601 [Argiope bruennichi]KAF8785763.1 hypothetical protein HNY73_011269 [Argiope bruennichi]
MVNQMEESPEMSDLQSTESIGEAAIILISIGSVLVILCAASIIYGLRRRRHILASLGGAPPAADENIHNPTDFMNKLATWDRSHSIDEILEKRRRSVWTLEIFENYGTSEEKMEKQFNSDS